MLIGVYHGYELTGSGSSEYARYLAGTCVLHQLPHEPVRPVYVTDKQRRGNVKPFVSLSMESLANGLVPVVSYFSGFKDSLDELEPLLGRDLVRNMKIMNDPGRRIENIISDISNLLDEPDLKKYTASMRQHAVENNDWKVRAERMVRAYTAIIES